MGRDADAFIERLSDCCHASGAKRRDERAVTMLTTRPPLKAVPERCAEMP
jgi:hypothetical protein